MKKIASWRFALKTWKAKSENWRRKKRKGKKIKGYRWQTEGPLTTHTTQAWRGCWVDSPLYKQVFDYWVMTRVPSKDCNHHPQVNACNRLVNYFFKKINIFFIKLPNYLWVDIVIKKKHGKTKTFLGELKKFWFQE